jgi:hypothetical protein
MEIVAAVEALPLEQRGVFVMFADAGLSLEEIAHATGVAVETAKSRLRYARAKLRQSLAARGRPMSDRYQAPDPIDRAYAHAERLLDDEAARAVRRARVLDALRRDAPGSTAGGAHIAPAAPLLEAWRLARGGQRCGVKRTCRGAGVFAGCDGPTAVGGESASCSRSDPTYRGLASTGPERGTISQRG